MRWILTTRGLNAEAQARGLSETAVDPLFGGFGSWDLGHGAHRAPTEKVIDYWNMSVFWLK